jgi:serine protease Do
LRIPYAVKGALVTDVTTGSNSAEAGLHRGDVIEEINHQTVGSAEESIKICKQAKGDWIFLKVWQRGGSLGNTRYLSVNNIH